MIYAFSAMALIYEYMHFVMVINSCFGATKNSIAPIKKPVKLLFFAVNIYLIFFSCFMNLRSLTDFSRP